MDRRKLYAHVYFRIPNNQLALAVYSIPKIPGFSGSVDREELSEEFGESFAVGKAQQLFSKVLGEDLISKEDQQTGKLMPYDILSENRLELLKRVVNKISKEENPQPVINIDDPMIWYNAHYHSLTEQEKELFDTLSDDQKLQFAEKLQQVQLEALEDDPEAGMMRIYTHLARAMYPKTGPKEYGGTSSKSKGTKYIPPVPPTLLVSKDRNLAFYPGYRGAQYMSQDPKSLKNIHPLKQSEEEKWAATLLENTLSYTNNKPLSDVRIDKLDYIVERLARIFYIQLRDQNDLELSAFTNSILPLQELAKQLLSDATRDEAVKEAGQAETWIDLGTGRLFRTKAELLGSKQDDQELAKAAQGLLGRLAKLRLKD